MTIVFGLGVYLLIGLIVSLLAGWAAEDMPAWHETWPTMLWWPIFLYIGVKAAMNEEEDHE